MPRYCKILLFFLFPIRLLAAVDSALYIHYDITNGLPSNNVYMSMQDHLGYVWFATDNGLVKYNGYKFKVFTTADGLPSNDVYKIMEDKKGRVWIYNLSHEFGYIKDDKYSKFSKKVKFTSYPSSLVEKDGKVSFISYAKQTGDSAIQYYLFQENDNNDFNCYSFNDQLQKLNYYEVQFSKSGNLYVVTKDDKLYKSNMGEASDVQFKYVGTLPYNVASTKGGRANMFLDRFLFYYWTRDSALSWCDLKTLTTQSLALTTPDAHSERAYICYSDNEYLHIISNKYLYTIDSNFLIRKKEKIDQKIFGGTQVSWFDKDFWGNTWICTNSEGVYLKVDSKHVLVLKRSLGIRAKALFMGESENVSYWYSEPVDELYLMNKTGVATAYKIKAEGRVRSISVIDSNNLRMAFNSGINSFELSTEKLSSFFAKYKKMIAHKFGIYSADYAISELVNDTLKKTILRNAIKIKNGRHNQFYIITSEGAYLVKPYRDSVFSVKLDPERFTDIEYDSVDGYAFFYNPNKLVVYDERKDRCYELDYKQIGLGLINKLNNVKTDARSNLFLLGDKSVVVYNLSTGVSNPITTNGNLLSSYMNVSDDNLIIAGRFGVSIAKIIGPGKVGSFKYWVNKNALFYRQVFGLANSGDGQVVINTDKGLYRTQIDIANTGEKFTNLSRKFFSLVLKNGTVDIVRGNDTFKIDQSTDVLSFDAINMNGSGLVNYSYKVYGADTGFKKLVGGEVLLGNLKVDRFYKVEVVLEDELWNSEPYIIYVYRIPYWYQTRLWVVIFWICGILFFTAIVLSIIYFTRRYVARANEKRQQLTDLELRAIHSQINPHFIFNTLSTALYFINKNEMENAYEHVNKFSHLLRSYLKSSQDRYISLANEIEMLRKYIELQQARFSQKFEFSIEVDNKVPANHILIPSLLLQPLVENAIAHGLFHKKEKGLLKIYFKQGNTNEDLICVIDDNGVGREQSKLIKDSSDMIRESYGSKLTQGLIDIFAQYEQMNIEVAYTDKVYPETGTIVKLTIRNIKYVTGD